LYCQSKRQKELIQQLNVSIDEAQDHGIEFMVQIYDMSKKKATVSFVVNPHYKDDEGIKFDTENINKKGQK
jgi:hypothetical protein